MSNLSDFWLQNFDDCDDHDDNFSESESLHTRKMIKLAAARRAITNYVSILTGKHLPVFYITSDTNCTDGKSIYLSTNITEKEQFDVAVGLALHEGSHIVYTDMKVFMNVWMEVPRSIYNYTEHLNIDKKSVGETCKTILNYIEDRYIDYTVYKNAPGYRGYYNKLYDHFFNKEEVSTALKSQLYRIPSVNSYLYRIINFTNPDTDLQALPGLYEIAKIINLSNVQRLKTTKDRRNVAYEVAEVIYKNIKESINENNGNITSTNDGADLSTNQNVDSIFGGIESQVEKTESDPYKTDVGEDDTISKTKQEKIKRSFEKQKDFVNGVIKKTKVSKRDEKILESLEKSKVSLVEVAYDFNKNFGAVGSIECVVVKHMTRDLLLKSNCPMAINPETKCEERQINENIKYVNEGLILGAKLGRKMQIRNEVNITKFTRRPTGKIDKRLLHELGFDQEEIFHTEFADKYKEFSMHISVDASSSMSDHLKWGKAIKLCVALAKASSMLDNVHTTISFRTTLGKNPYLLIAYDSKVDKVAKIRNLFPLLKPTNVTPEGLCFEALVKNLPKNELGVNKYFINISDGMPYIEYTIDDVVIKYEGETAAQHTKSQVSKIKNNGYQVISYFIKSHTDTYSAYSAETQKKIEVLFKMMYGSDSNFIDVNDVNQISNTLKKKMMERIDI